MFVVMSGLFTRVASSLYTGLSVQRKVRPDMFPSSLFGVSGRHASCKREVQAFDPSPRL